MGGTQGGETQDAWKPDPEGYRRLVERSAPPPSSARFSTVFPLRLSISLVHYQFGWFLVSLRLFWWRRPRRPLRSSPVMVAWSFTLSFFLFQGVFMGLAAGCERCRVAQKLSFVCFCRCRCFCCSCRFLSNHCTSLGSHQQLFLSKC